MNEQYQGGNKFYTAPIQNTDNLDPNKAPIDNGYPAYQKSNPWKTALVAGARARMPGKAQAARYYARQMGEQDSSDYLSGLKASADQIYGNIMNDPLTGYMQNELIKPDDISGLNEDIINKSTRQGRREPGNKLQFQGGISPLQRLQQNQQ